MLAASAGALSGCSTTMQEAARLQLNDARIRASQGPTVVVAPGGAVRVSGVSVVRDGGQTAFVVRVRNLGRRAVSDLPISVGVRSGRRRIYANVESPLEYSYFDSHLPVVAAGGGLTWVYTTGQRLPAGARPFATVGAQPRPPAAASGQPPVIRASLRAAAAETGRLAIVLTNLSSVPQYQLQIYAFARAAGRYVAAGALTVPHLGTGSRRTIELSLLGRAGAAPPQVEVLPTIFH